MLLPQSLTPLNLTTTLQTLSLPLLLTFLLYLLTTALYNRYLHPLASYPGPFWASLTHLWYFRVVRHGLSASIQLPLHKKYGPFVRISPDTIQISDPAAIETIYGPGNGFVKAEFYSGFDANIGTRKSSFEMRDESEHRVRRRIVAPLYTQGSVLAFEPCVDRVIGLFCGRMEGFGKEGEGRRVDMSDWLRKYAFDVIGEMFYGREGGFGFVRDDIDYNNWCLLMETMPPLASAITYIPKPFRSLVFLAEMLWPSTRTGAVGFFDVIKQSKEAVKQRLEERANGTSKFSHDLLSRLLDLINPDKSDQRNFWAEEDVVSEIWAIIWAGADTTAIALTSIFYHLHKNPSTLETLRAEIDAAFEDGRLTYPLRFSQCIRLPYLHAVVREGMRVHSSLGLGLPRIVPPGGATICGKYFPGGYTVTMNACAVNFDQGIYGEDSEGFRPERWLEDEGRAKEMERHGLQFGYGPRVCIGKHITNVEMYKLLPTVLREFEFEGMGEREWRTFGGWFHQVKGVDVVVRRRCMREREGTGQ